MMQIENIRFDPTFVEETVFLSVRAKGEGDALVESFHRDREKVYGIVPIPEEQETNFRHVYEQYFIQLSLHQPFQFAIHQFPLLRTSNVLIFIKKVCTQKEEESELYGQQEDKTVYVGLQAMRVLDDTFLNSFLCHEMMHISDMLDSHFQYSPHPNLGGRSEVEDNFIKDRFRVLWNFYVDVRLEKMGLSTLLPRDHHQRNFNRAFPLWGGEQKEKVLHRILKEDRLTQAELLHFANDQRAQKTFEEGGRRCPLCDFICYERVKDWSGEGALVIRAIQKDHPNWLPSSGVCLQCFEMYTIQQKIETPSP